MDQEFTEEEIVSDDSQANNSLQYEVDKILAHKYENGQYRFKVRWIGYPQPGFDDSFEPLSNLEGSFHLLKKYFAKKKLLDIERDPDTNQLHVVKRFKPGNRKSGTVEKAVRRNRKSVDSSLTDSSDNSGRENSKNGPVNICLTGDSAPTTPSTAKKPNGSKPQKSVRKVASNRSQQKNTPSKPQTAHRGIGEEPGPNSSAQKKTVVEQVSCETSSEGLSNIQKKRKAPEDSSGNTEEYDTYVFENPFILNRKSGFENGWTPERILAVVKPERDQTEELHYIVKWRDCAIAEPVPSKILVREVPEMLVQFLENNMTWDDEEQAMQDS